MSTNAFEVNVLTIFPELFASFKSSSLIGKAIERGLLKIDVTNIRDYASPPHFQVDDTPYGGGAGMVMLVEPLVKSIEAVRERAPRTHVVLLSAAGNPFTQRHAESLARKDSLTLVCGRYEGVDQRVVDLAVDEEISIGDFVVMGGEVPAMMIIEATARLRSDVIGNSASLAQESFGCDHETLLEAPHYTRPPEFRGLKVPEVLLSGNHQKIATWRKAESTSRTKRIRPVSPTDRVSQFDKITP